MLVTVIRDHGLGINLKKRLGKLFDTFSFAQPGTSQLNKAAEGVGVGLSTSWALTQGLGGQI